MTITDAVNIFKNHQMSNLRKSTQKDYASLRGHFQQLRGQYGQG